MPDSDAILITGCTGFIGQAVARAALSRGYRVTGLSRQLPTADSSVDEVEYFHADLSCHGPLSDFLAGRRFHYVVNCAGYINHRPYSDGGRGEIDSHLIGLMNLVQSIDRDALKGFVQIGSSDEYGDAPAPQSESHREQPISPYSFAKASASHFLQMLFRTEGFPASVARLFLVYGPGQNAQRFFPQIIAGCLNDQHFAASKGEQLRDFCFIDDVADGILRLLTCDTARGEVVNVASGKAITIKEVVETIQKAIGRGAPGFGEIPYRPGENMSLYADISKMRRLTGWRPDTDLDSGITQTIDWYAQR